jgi:hypothetical protein
MIGDIPCYFVSMDTDQNVEDELEVEYTKDSNLRLSRKPSIVGRLMNSIRRKFSKREKSKLGLCENKEEESDNKSIK